MASEELDMASMMSTLNETRLNAECEYCESCTCPDMMLLEAAEHGRAECIGHAVAAGADVYGIREIHSSDRTTLMVAAELGHSDCVKALLEAGAIVDMKEFYNARLDGYSGDTALIKAAKKGRDKCVVYLIEAGADVNVRTRGGYTALMHASRNHFPESVAVLINAGADVNMTNRERYSALILAVKSDSTTTVDYVIAAKADVNYKVSTLLDFATSGSVATMKSLLRAGIPINTPRLKVPPQYTSKMRQNVESTILLRKAAGECLEFEETEFNLKSQCRKAIRNHLLNLDPHTHLFCRVRKLGLPKLLQRYLVYNENVYDDCGTTGAVGENDRLQHSRMPTIKPMFDSSEIVEQKQCLSECSSDICSPCKKNLNENNLCFHLHVVNLWI